MPTDPMPALEAVPRTVGDVWVIQRDRGSDRAREMTDRLLHTLEATRGAPQVYPFLPLSPTDRQWRSRLLGQPVEDAYVKVFRFRPA